MVVFCAHACACVALRCVCDWPRNVNQFPVSSPIRCTFAFHPSNLPPPTCLPDYCLVVYAVGASLGYSVSHNHNHSFDSANEPAHTPAICFKHLLVQAPSSLETRTPTGKLVTQRHCIITSSSLLSPKTPDPTPSCPLWHPWTSNLRTLTPSYLLACPHCYLTVSLLLLIAIAPVRSQRSVRRVQAPLAVRARRPGCQAATRFSRLSIVHLRSWLRSVATAGSLRPATSELHTYITARIPTATATFKPTHLLISLQYTSQVRQGFPRLCTHLPSSPSTTPRDRTRQGTAHAETDTKTLRAQHQFLTTCTRTTSSRHESNKTPHLNHLHP